MSCRNRRRGRRDRSRPRAEPSHHPTTCCQAPMRYSLIGPDGEILASRVGRPFTFEEGLEILGNGGLL